MSKLLKLARASGTPIIDHQTVTFVWEGERAPVLIADFTDWENDPIQLTRVGKKTWTYEVDLPKNAYIEYAFIDLQSNKRFSDPYNPRSVPNGLGDVNHFFHMPDASLNPLTRRAKGIPKGEISRHLVNTGELAAGKQRRAYLYHPPTSTPCPLVIVLDGNDYLRRGKLTQILDNLLAQNRIRPVALAMVAHGGKVRGVEYLCSEATIGFLLERVLPLAKRELNLVDLAGEPGAYGIMGASLAGLMALYTGLRQPQIFGRVLSQSAGFGFEERDFVVKDLVRYLPKRAIKIWMDVGIYDCFLSVNQGMYDLLVERGYQVQYREYPGGHNYSSWRNDLWRGLEFLFPPFREKNLSFDFSREHER